VSVQIKPTDDLQTCLALRRVVFIEEQDVPEADEVDAYDACATHLLACDAGQPLGTARVVQDGTTAKIGRVCVLPVARSRGIGAGLIQAALQVSAQMDGVQQARLGAQLHALGFYEKLGFSVVGSVYLDAGIEHRDMVFPLS
jgi:predicted GNAT family N-acyltransferase